MSNKSFLLLGSISAFLVLAGCKKPYPGTESEYSGITDNNALKWISDGNYKIVTSFSAMPQEIQDKILPPSEKMADPHQRFNSTDVIREGLPMRRFTTGGFSNEMAFVVYEQGGRAHNQKVVVIKRTGNRDILFFGYCDEIVSSMEQLKSIIKSGKVQQVDDRASWSF